ncbi:mRNA (2'-O-methyladenosine-N(6)-)-methyltransferase [Aureococcus anophagefferens]|uniref:mRNA (2'-O-methyladenosine-N(6)-)-methyltransferase n=1 Tax=Aureococcus anophagefferens TaxID=44056 RepID=A0ABR1FSQ3_AURAN
MPQAQRSSTHNIKMEIWNSTTRIERPTTEAHEAYDLCDAGAELARFNALKSLRSVFARLVTTHGGGGKAPPLAFERWLARSALARATAPDGDCDGERGARAAPLALLPAAPSVDGQLVADLARSFSRDAALAIAEAVSAQGRSAAARQAASYPGGQRARSGAPQTARPGREARGEARRRRRRLARARLRRRCPARARRGRGGRRPAAACEVSVARKRGGKVVVLSALDDAGDARKPYMTLNGAHFDKLVQLHGRHGRPGDGDVHARIFCLLARYEALRGAGFQCAVPGAAFDGLEAYLGPTVECFASPLNCRFERYYSAFPFLERPFGSLGSFFGDVAIDGGSFEANPPFVPEVMAFMVDRIAALLEAASGPLSFLVVVPDWGGGSSAAGACRRSRFLRARHTVRAADHVFADGAQHRVADRYRPSSWDTAVLLLQNDSGAATWPLDTPTLAATMRRSFTRAANDPKAPAKREDLQAWERRGPARGGKRTPAPPAGKPKKKKARNDDAAFFVEAP